MIQEQEVSENNEAKFSKDQDKSGLVLVTLIVIVAIGIFFRFYHLKDIYYELDDVYWVTAHKTPITDIVRTKSLNEVDIQVTVKKELIHNLLDSPLYGFYVAYISTSPILAYLFHPLFIDESDSFYEKILKSRGYVSVLCSIGLILFVYLLYVMNGRKLASSFILPVAIFSFSFNAVLYSHNAGPYGLAPTVMVVALILFYRLLENENFVTPFFLCLAVLSLFSYLVLLTLPLFLVLTACRYRLFNAKKAFLFFYKGLLCYGVIFGINALLFLKMGDGGNKGAPVPTDIEGFQVLGFISGQFINAIIGSFASFSTNQFINQCVVASVIGVGLCLLGWKAKHLGKDIYVYLFVFMYFGTWVVLYCLGKLPMGPNRYTLPFLPLICLVVYFISTCFKLRFFVHLVLVLPFLVFGISNNHSIINSKLTNFDFEAIERNPINTIVLYGGSMASLIYFQDSKRVIYGNSKNFNYHFTKLNLPDEILLVSEDHSIHQTFENNLHFCPSLNIPKERCWFDYLQSNYEIKMIEEKPSNVRYTYTNWTWGGLGGGGNGYFLYEARRKAPENM